MALTLSASGLIYFLFSFIYDLLSDDNPREDKEIGHEVPYKASASRSTARRIKEKKTD